ncbi:MAG: translation elongation factor Ts, partial [Pseudomonadota bacterium]
SGRTASEGLVVVAVENAGAGAKGVAVEVNSETDFVARNELFQKMVSEIAAASLSTDGSIDATRAVDFPGAGKSVEDHVAEMVGQIGENMTVRRSNGIAVDEGVVAHYIHGAATDSAGKIGVLVGLKSAGDKAKLADLGKKVAMHVAAARPLAATVDDLDADVVAREKDVLADQARASGKPEEIIAKMVEGRLRKFYEESVLLEQVFVMDGETRVGKVIDNAASDVGAPVELVGFVRLELGEGVEKSDDED